MSANTLRVRYDPDHIRWGMWSEEPDPNRIGTVVRGYKIPMFCWVRWDDDPDNEEFLCVDQLQEANDEE